MKAAGSTARATGVLAVMLIIFLSLLGLHLVCRPGIHIDRWRVPQRAQFHSMEAAIELFKDDLGSYPPSDANDPEGRPYCGAMKLCEAMMGRDLLGFHPTSILKQDATDSDGNRVYLPDPNNLKAREGPFLPLESANAIMLGKVYGQEHTGPFPPELYVLCDVFKQRRPSGEKTGMPILYYHADPKGTVHDPCDPDNPDNIYDYRDNQAVLELGVPGKPGVKHRLADPKVFYETIRNHRLKSSAQLHKVNAYILISAGIDGIYGTPDDVCYLGWRRPSQ